MIGNFLVKIFIIIPLFIHGLHSAIQIGHVDTSDGYCDLDGFGRIPVGQYSEHFERCQQAYCGDNFYRIETCGVARTDSKDCKIEIQTGRYPKCCPRVQCDAWIIRNKEWFCEWCKMRGQRHG